MPLNTEQIAAFARDGFVLVEHLFDPADMAAALADMEQIFYGRPFADYLATYDRTGAAQSIEPTRTNAVNHYGDTIYGRVQFPTGYRSLDRLIEDGNYLDMFAQCLDTEDISYCNAHLFLRSGPTDRRCPEHPWQGYHADNGTNSFLPVGTDPDAFSYVNSVVYLHDVDDGCAPMHVIPGSHRQAGAALTRLEQPGGSIPDIREVAEFAAPVSTAARAGSALFYSSYLIHAAVPFADRRRQRALWTLSMARADTSRWAKLANPWSRPEREHFHPFWTHTSPRVRSLFGWPPPGHPYYTETTLKSIELMYPEMDLAPYRS